MGGKSSREKGARYERKIANYLSERLDIFARRRIEQYQTGGDDLVHGLDQWLSIEAKDVASTSLGSWVDQAVEQAGPLRIPVVIHHRRGNTNAANDFATLPLAELCLLLDALVNVGVYPVRPDPEVSK
jgi:hypothetical protein